jgi:DNA-binding response OmpR family regulator
MAQAFDKMVTVDPDIILMDLNLPDSTGIDTIKQFIEKFPNKLIIVLTGLVDEKTGLEAVRYGAQDFLVKGKFDSKVLVSSIIFAFERFALNKRLSSVNQDLNKGEERFELLQEMSNTGFIEFNIEKRIIYLSKFLMKQVNIPVQEFSLDQMLTLYENKKEKMLQTLDEILNDKKETGTIRYFSIVSNKEISAFWKKDGKLITFVIPYPTKS